MLITALFLNVVVSFINSFVFDDSFQTSSSDSFNRMKKQILYQNNKLTNFKILWWLPGINFMSHITWEKHICILYLIKWYVTQSWVLLSTQTQCVLSKQETILILHITVSCTNLIKYMYLPTQFRTPTTGAALISDKNDETNHFNTFSFKRLVLHHATEEIGLF